VYIRFGTGWVGSRQTGWVYAVLDGPNPTQKKRVLDPTQLGDPNGPVFLNRFSASYLA